jgi:tetratricopeptide (TPR) repeat protein
MKHTLRVCALSCIISILFVPSMYARQQSAEDLRRLGRIAFFEARYPEAERYLRQSVAAHEADPDSTPTDLAVGRGDLAWYLIATGGFDEAERLLDSALAILRKQKPQSSDHLALTLSHRGTLHQIREQYGRAESVFKEALKHAERSKPSYKGVVLNNLGVLYGTKGKWKQARTVIEKALAIVEAQPNDMDTLLELAQTLTSLAAVHRIQDRFAMAEQLLARAIGIANMLQVGVHATLSATVLSMAVEQMAHLHAQRGDLDKAEQELRRAQEIEITQGRGVPSRVTKLSFELAQLLTAKGRYEDAKTLYQQAIPSGTVVSAEIATRLESYSKLLRKMKAHSQAEEVEFRAKKIRAALSYTVPVR